MVPFYGNALVAVESELQRELLRLLLTRQRWSVKTAASGYETVTRLADALLFARTDVRPDLVVTQPVLLGLSGMTLAEEMRALGWETRIIFLVNAGSSAFRQRIAAIPDVAVLETPLSAGAFLRLTRAMRPRPQSPGHRPAAAAIAAVV